MNNHPSVFRTLIWIRKNRSRKKWKLNKQTLSLIIDGTTSIYLFAFLIILLIALKSYLSELQPFLQLFDQFSYTWLLTIFIAVIIRAFIHSFRSSGVYLTSAEYQLTLLPYKKEKVWLFCLLERLIRMTLYTLLLFAIILIFLPLKFEVALLLCLTIWIGNLAGIGIEWHLFQIGGMKKFLLVASFVILLAGVRALIYWIQLPAKEIHFIAMGLAVVCAILLLTIAPLKKVDWAKVVAFGDSKVWNLMLVSQMTKVRIKPPTKFLLLNKLFRGKRAKRPLPYKLSSVSVRLWLPFMRNNSETITRTIGVFLLLMIVFGLQGKMALQTALAIGILAVNSVISSLFIYHFQSPIMQVLPWRFRDWYFSFKKWYVMFLLLYVIVSIGMLYFYDFPLIVIFVLELFYSIWLWVDLDLIAQMKINTLQKNEKSSGFLLLFRLIGGIIVFMTLSYPWLSLIGILLAFVIKTKGPIGSFIEA
jgi:hypothetical protein